MTQDHTRPSDATRNAEKDEARADHRPDRAASADEERAAEAASSGVDVAGVTAHAKEMAERGAHQRGEGRI